MNFAGSDARHLLNQDSLTRNLVSDDDEVVKPLIDAGSLWIMPGCVYGREAIDNIQKSSLFSSTFSVLVYPRETHELPEEERPRQRRNYAERRRRALTPDALSSGMKQSASHSPSPARRRRSRALQVEEEDGDDLDTLHLFDTILPRIPSSIVNGEAQNSQDSSRRPTTRSMLSLQGVQASDRSPSLEKRLDAGLDRVGLSRLQQHKQKAQQEMYAFLKRKDAEFMALRKDVEMESRALRDRALHSSVRADLHHRNHSDKLSAAQEGEQADSEQPDQNSPLFVRRKPPGPSFSDQPSFSSVDPSGNQLTNQSLDSPAIVGSYLSTSFAMRGRDLPSDAEKKEMSREDEEELFAAKRRLRERYPHADHSALPSAVNSDDEGAVEIKQKSDNEETDEEQNARGRGRGRVYQREEKPEDVEEKAKESFGELSKSSTSKKGAMKISQNDKGKTASAVAEKKVAFASTNQEVEPSSSTHLQNPEEQGESIFDIDEDLDGEDNTPTSSDITLHSRQEGMSQEESDNNHEEDKGHTTSPEAGQGIGSSALDNVSASLSMVGSLSAMVLSEEKRQARRLVQDEQSANFDPASLRFDGREIYSESTGASVPVESLEDAEQSRDGSRAVRPHSLLSRSQIAQASLDEEALLSDLPQDRQDRSTIGFRVSVGEAEARLSGLLAPNAPSHRNLWSQRKRNKYNLADIDDDIIEEETFVKRDQGKELDKKSPQLLTLADKGDDTGLARSVPIGMAPNMMRISSSSTFRDATSAFDLEPKTSLPYQEKKMTPSLRKATRHLDVPSSGRMKLRKPSLGAISDASENSGLTPDVDGSQQQKGQHSDSSPSSGAVRTSDQTSVAASRPTYTYNMPGSIQRGFQSSTSDVFPSTQNSHTGTVSASEIADLAASVARVSRAPYVQPPPPMSHSIRLEPNDKHRPASIPLPQIDTDFAEDMEKELEFMHVLEKLKLNKRTGWLHHRVALPESIADHMYRMAVLSLLLPGTDLDIGKCVQLCVVHDIAEALVGDLTPLDNVSKEEKLRREHEALLYFVHDLLGGSQAALRLEALWNEYEDRQTLESRTVKDLDRFELALQAVEYERKWNTTDLQPFFDGSSGAILHPRVRLWIRQLAKERQLLWSTTSYKYHQVFP